MSEESEWGETKKERDTPKMKKAELTDHYLYKLFDGPTTWFNENVVGALKTKKKIPYYHRRFKRVPTIDECVLRDMPCVFEANEQYKRDKQVDGNIIRILRQRYVECQYYEGPDAPRKCKAIKEQYLDTSTNYFIKYGDLGYNTTVVDALMKQKHRMIWERDQAEKNGS